MCYDSASYGIRIRIWNHQNNENPTPDLDPDSGPESNLDVGGRLADAAVGGRDDRAGVVHGAAAAVAEAAEDAAELRRGQIRFQRVLTYVVT